MFFDTVRLHIVEEFNRDIYDYIIASDESVFDAVASTSSILYKYMTCCKYCYLYLTSIFKYSISCPKFTWKTISFSELG